MLIKNVEKGRLLFTNDIKEAIKSAEVIFHCAWHLPEKMEVSNTC